MPVPKSGGAVPRRLAALLLAGILLAGIVPAARADDSPFRDVKSGAWYYPAVMWAYGEKITAGTSADTFSPKRELTYGEIATFLYKYAYSPLLRSRSPALSVYENKYCWKALNWCCDVGILSVRDVTGTRSPHTKLTRSDFVCVLYCYADKWEHRSVAADERLLAPYSDAPADALCRKAWSWAISAGVVNGTTAGRLSPDRRLTRADCLQMLYRYDTQAAPLQGEALMKKRLRGWQRTLLETGETALGAEWVDEAYELDEDGIPTAIDCSGLVNWVFTRTGFRPYDDMDCWPLWNSEVFSRAAAKRSGESGCAFFVRCQKKLKPGDLLFSRRSASRNHVMIYLGSTDRTVYVLESVAGKGVCFDSIPIDESAYYLKYLYGVKRYNP